MDNSNKIPESVSECPEIKDLKYSYMEGYLKTRGPCYPIRKFKNMMNERSNNARLKIFNRYFKNKSS